MAEAERVFTGIAASDGLVWGPVVRAAATGAAAAGRPAGAPADERAALEAALGRARGQIAALIAGADTLAGDILEFQLALLEDDDLLAPVRAAVDGGAPADAAWRDTLDGEIAAYREGGDEYMTARAEDLLDLQRRVSRALAGDAGAEASVAAGSVLVADELTPSRFLELDWRRLGGAATTGGSRTSHVSILARARGVPLVVGLRIGDDGALAAIPEGAAAVLDAEEGRLIVAPSTETLVRVAARADARAARASGLRAALAAPAVTAAGARIAVQINVDEPGILDAVDPSHCDGIGLTRTELLFEGGPPAEEAQLAVYRRILAWAGGRPVTVRTLDAGGDKPIPGVTLDGEANPFLGVRGLRLSLRAPGPFRAQLRALARAAADGPLKIMVPMVTVPTEIEAVRALLAEVVADLEAAGVPHAAPPLGMMVEVPAAALGAERFDVDFYSIGSNDLVQYVTACARDNPALADLARADDPAVLELIGRVASVGRARGVEVSLCGDMASDPALVPLLLERGLRTLSVAPAQLARVKQAVAAYGGGNP